MSEPTTLTLEEALNRAIAHHRAEQLQEAKQLYLGILQAHPQNPDANHNLGVLLMQLKQPDTALLHFRKALEINPKPGQYWLSYIDALVRTGQTTPASQVLQQGKSAGLRGPQVDVLENQIETMRQATLENRPSAPKTETPIRHEGITTTAPATRGKHFSKIAKQHPLPRPEEISTLINLCNQGRNAEAESIARTLTTTYPEHGFGWKALGVLLRRKGSLETAQKAMREATRLLPDDADAHYNLGNIYQQQGHFAEAETSYKRALDLAPDIAPAHFNLANLFQSQGRFSEAEASYRRALQIKPDHADFHCNLANTLQDLGRLAEAEASYRRALEINAGHVGALGNLGLNLQDQGRMNEAEACHRRVLELKPQHAGAHSNLGLALKDQGRLIEAEASFRQALRINPSHANAHNNLGNILKEQGRLTEAEAAYRQALAIQPNHAHAHSNLGNVLKEQGRLSEAETSYRQSLAINPHYADAHNNLGNTLKELRHFIEAEASFRQALEIDPEHAEAYCNLGNLFKDQSRLCEAEASYRRALKIKPDYFDARSNLLGLLNYSNMHTAEACLEEARQYGHFAAARLAPAAPFSSWNCSPEPARLRVGLVSGDLRSHPVGYFLENLLTHISPAKIELIAYPTHHLEDMLTGRIRPHFTAWKPLLGLNDEMAATLIRNDGIHILIDLSGHTAHNRLPLFAWRPSPVQVSWLGYFATTGVAAMDYLLADRTGVPQSALGHFTESIWYLPQTRLCFTPPATRLPVAPLPALTRKHITFGSFQNLAKVGDNVLAAWGRILQAIPNARIHWQCKQFDDQQVAENTLTRLNQHGITSTQITLQGASDRETYLATYAEIDIILDTFPYPGGTTTCEALWMGVPTLTLAGDRLHARQGASLLTAADLKDWIATTTEEYVSKAIARAQDIPALSMLRTDMRKHVSCSPLFDGQRFADDFVAALWGMWHEKQTRHHADQANISSPLTPQHP